MWSFCDYILSLSIFKFHVYFSVYHYFIPLKNTGLLSYNAHSMEFTI